MLQDKPMIAWVYERVKRVTAFDNVIVATDDTRIYDAVEGFGGEVLLTKKEHPSGTDRAWEVAKEYPEAAYVFNIQGDEPLINPLYLEEAVRELKFYDKKADIITMRAPIGDETDLQNPNIVKVVTTQTGQALYFSRSPIPFEREPLPQEDNPEMEPKSKAFRHVGVYGYKRESLQKFVALPVSPLENTEKLEQLRALEAGMHIQVITIPTAPVGVDTPEDLAHVAQLLQKETTP